MTIKSNIRYLKALVNNRSPTRSQQENVVKKYEERKIANKLSAENLILKLQNSRRSIEDKALKELEKHAIELLDVQQELIRGLEKMEPMLSKAESLSTKLESFGKH